MTGQSQFFNNNNAQYAPAGKYPAAANQAQLMPIDGDPATSNYLQYGLYGLIAISLLVMGFMSTKFILDSGNRNKLQPVNTVTASQFAVIPNSSIGSRVLSEINTMLSRQFSVGEWRLSGTEVSQNNIVQIYIQIPQKLEMSKTEQQNYIRQVLCPASTSGLWQLIHPSQMQFNMFTTIKRLSVSAACG